MRVLVEKYEWTELDKVNMKKVALEVIRQAFNIPNDAFLNAKGKLMRHEDHYHGSGWDEEIRKATEEDKIAFKALAKVNDWGR